jgi:hypothetical protein
MESDRETVGAGGILYNLADSIIQERISSFRVKFEEALVEARLKALSDSFANAKPPAPKTPQAPKALTSPPGGSNKGGATTDAPPAGSGNLSASPGAPSPAPPARPPPLPQVLGRRSERHPPERKKAAPALSGGNGDSPGDGPSIAASAAHPNPT